MLLFVGLGNPGKEYDGTRHNIGFEAADALARASSASDFKEKFSGVWTKGRLGGEDIVILKPMTFMNLSGQSVQPAAAFFKVTPGEIVVLHDELDLPFGDVRLKKGGGHAGHNGLRSMIERLGTPDFARVRLGIGRPPAGFRGEVADYVLSRFDGIERVTVGDVITRATAMVEDVAKSGLAAAMNKHHTKAKLRSRRGERGERHRVRLARPGDARLPVAAGRSR